MYELKTKATPQAVTTFLDAIEDETKRDDCYAIAALMEEATGQPATMWGTAIIGFDKYHYKYASGHEGEMCAVGFSPRKANITLYLALGDEGAKLLPDLGKHKMSKACLHIKKMADVDEEVLKDLISIAFQNVKEQYPD